MNVTLRGGAATLGLLLACIGLAACGSSKSSTSTDTASVRRVTSTPTTGASATGAQERRLTEATFRAALAKYGDCLRVNGIKLPPPNTSGKGPIFDTKGISTTSPQFKAASAKCRGALAGAITHPAGAPEAAAPSAGSKSTG